ncbi:MAG: DUF2252 family protein [Burkholderiales bacterium]|nr:DUF2252 family protein [Burkholderiales bacterium]
MRVAVGQWLMQSSSDIFLGWLRGRRGHDFYARQLRDMKMSMPVEGFSAVHSARLACGCCAGARRRGRPSSRAGQALRSERQPAVGFHARTAQGRHRHAAVRGQA